MDQNGQLVTSSGFQIVPAIILPETAKKVMVGRDGIVSVEIEGSPAPQQVGQLTLTTFINDSGLESVGENLVLRNSQLRSTY